VLVRGVEHLHIGGDAAVLGSSFREVMLGIDLRGFKYSFRLLVSSMRAALFDLRPIGL